MKRIVSFMGILLFALTFFSCKEVKKATSVTVSNQATGIAGEVVLVMDKPMWSQTARDIVLKSLSKPQPGINQIEPIFDVIEIDNNSFNSNFQGHRNILRFDIKNEYPHNQISIEKNPWKAGQVYVRIKGYNVDSCVALYLENEQKILEDFYENDLARMQYFTEKDPERNIQKVIQDKFGISLSVPKQYFIAREENDFVWLRCRTQKNDRFIMIYRAQKLDPAFLATSRNIITKKYIPGAVKGAYPIVAQEGGAPTPQEMTIGNKTGWFMRGLWESVNDKMGGPFVSFTFEDPASAAHSITVDGFVYAPQEPKRDYIREVEAIVKSVK